MDGFFVFGFALTMTPVAGPSPPFRFSTSLISGRSRYGPFDPTFPMILGPPFLGKALSIARRALLFERRGAASRRLRQSVAGSWLTLSKVGERRPQEKTKTRPPAGSWQKGPAPGWLRQRAASTACGWPPRPGRPAVPARRSPL